MLCQTLFDGFVSLCYRRPTVRIQDLERKGILPKGK